MAFTCQTIHFKSLKSCKICYNIKIKGGFKMIAYLNGLVKFILPDYIVVEVNQIGYKVITPNPYLFIVDEEVSIFTYLSVREDALDLYGFKRMDEKELFIKLISVTGIGPKSACAILAGGDVANVVDAIDRGDVTYLTKFPKVGPKTAQQIILDLKGKLKHVTSTVANVALEEATEALKALGYSDKEIMRVSKHLVGQMSTQEYITKALQMMLK
jgi:Holliday junction DNA helicase RuvA